MSGARARQGAMSGPRKAAILMAIIGEEAAAAVFRQLSQTDVQKITTELATLDTVSPETAQEILEEYQKLASTQRFVIQGGTDYAHRLLNKAFGESGAKEVKQQIAQSNKAAAKLDWLRHTDPQQLATFLEKEHPQTAALILAHLEPRHASQVISKLSSDVRTDTVKRIAQLRQFSPEIAETISNVLNQKLKPVSEQKKQSKGPSASISELMNHLEPTTSRSILEAIGQENPDLANEIRDMMFTFEDMIEVTDAALRDWLSNVDKKTLALALKGASEPLKEHIFKAMSSRAVEMLKEDMEVLGRVRARDVTKAQQEAIAVARQLESEGKIVLRAEGDDEFIA